jgi:TonB-dependent receptor
MKFFKVLVTFGLLILSGLSLTAQNGVISGVVRDSKTKETIVGANVVISGTTTGSASDLDGRFQINNLKPGTYALSVSFVSYTRLDIPIVKVEAGKVTNIIADIEEVSTTITGVTITAKQGSSSEITVISMIKSADLVVSGISTQQIQRSQDRDASEVIRRVPGINVVDNRFVVVRGLSERYNTVWINGVSTPSYESDVKAFSFDNIPSSMIERIMVYKTPAPELPGDFAGGAVQIFTRNSPVKNTIDISLSGAWRTRTTFNEFYRYQGGKTDWLGFDDGTRSLPDGFPDYNTLIAKVNSLDPNDQAYITELGQSMNKIWSASKSKAAPDLRFSIGSTYSKDLRNSRSIGNITAINYSNTSQFLEIFRADYQNFDTVQDVSDTSYFYNDRQYTNTAKIGVLHNWSFKLSQGTTLEFRNLFNQIGFSRTTFRDGEDFYGGSVIRAYEYRYMSRSIYSGQLAGKHKINENRTKIDWTLGYSYANRNEPDLKRIMTVKSIDDPDNPHYGDYGMQISTAATPELTGRMFVDMSENIYNGVVNLEHKFSLGKFEPELKFGVYVEQKERAFNTRLIGYKIARTSQFNWDLPFLPFDSLFADGNINNTNGIKLDEKTNASDSYTAENSLMAAYIALNLPITSSLKLYAGIRVEKNRQQLNSFQIDQPTVPVYVDLDTINILPSFNMSYDLSENSLLRMAYGMTINRPEFREIAPLLFYDFEKKAGIRGNPNLVNAYIHSFDFRYELYPSLAEQFTLGVFYKHFINPIETRVIPAGSGLDYTFNNALGAYDYGAELEFRKSLSNFPGSSLLSRSIQNLSLVMNATYIKSLVQFEEGNLQEDRPLQGQSPYIINAGFFYNNDSTGLMFSMMYNVIGKRIVYVGDPYSGNPDTWELPRQLLDLTIRKSFGDHLEIKGGIQDILANNVIFRQTIEYNKDNDGDGLGDGIVEREQTLLNYRPGPYYSLGITLKW